MKRCRHRAAKEELNGRIRALQKIIKQQRREISRLQKMQQYQEFNAADNDEEGLEPVLTPLPSKKTTNKHSCQNCHSANIRVLDLIQFVYHICDDCDYRKRVVP